MPFQAFASVIGGILGQENNQATNAANMAQTLQNESWQTEMSNTAMQRRVGDLNAAGLNPMLAVGGPGASVPSVSPIPMQSSNALGQGIAQAAIQLAQKQNIDADTNVKNANAKQITANTQNNVNATIRKPDGTIDWNAMNLPPTPGNLNAQGLDLDNQAKQKTLSAIEAATARDRSQADLNAANNAISSLNYKQQQQLYDVTMQRAAAELGIEQAEAQTEKARATILGNPTWGPILALFAPAAHLIGAMK